MGKSHYLIILLVIFLISVIGILISVSQSSLVSVAAPGGSLTEGVIGTPRFVNPILAETNTERDLTMLIFSGLVRLNEKGEWEGDLAEEYSVSDDGLAYTFTLKDGLSWHDGAPLTVDDIIFTIDRIKRPGLKSPQRGIWENIEVEKVNDKQLIFRLKQPSTNFLSIASLGIIPKHLWSSVEDESFTYNPLNLKAIGSGPYRVNNVRTDSSNTPIAFELKSFKDFALGQPPISNLIIKFYGSESDLITAYRQGEVVSLSGVSAFAVGELIETGAKFITLPLPRIFAIFFNPNKNELLLNKRVRQALAIAINKQEIVDQVLLGFGETLTAPLPKHFLTQLDLEAPESDYGATALEILEAVKIDPKDIKITLSTSDTPELRRAAEMIRDNWQELGVVVDLKIFELGALNQNVIRPREYEALFFGEVIGRDLDLYPFWHSSQRLDPFLNVAMYTNISVDRALESIRDNLEPENRREAYQTVLNEINTDLPAIFIYTPTFLYALPEFVNTPSWFPPNAANDRFSTIHKWYIKTDRIWKIFTQNKLLN